MPAMNKELSISLAELETISIACADCRTAILLKTAGSPDVTQCPCCHRELDVKNALTRLFGALAVLRDSRHAVSFVVKE
jgi:hypothetical protein